MTRGERAKQFMPFDAMKGLQEALRKREERHSRVEKRELSEEAGARLTAALQCTAVGQAVRVRYYKEFHEYTLCGRVAALDAVNHTLTVGEEIIPFDNLYALVPDITNGT